MKYCSKHHENPDDAKYCRICGMAFSPAERYKRKIISTISRVFTKTPKTARMFTLDTFRNVSLRPVSIVKMRFIKKGIVLLFIISALIFIGTATGLIGQILLSLDQYSYRVYRDYYLEPLVGIGSLSISVFCSIMIIRFLIKKLRYKLNADYIEDRFLDHDIVRIAHKSKMGLFDKKKKKVLLDSIYCSIDKFDNQHLIITKDERKGIYSIVSRKIIIPVRYDSISQFVNSVATAKIGTDEFHYDVKGNRLE